MKILERTIFKKKNEEIEKLKQELINVSNKSAYNYERNKELNNTILDLSDEIYVLRKDKMELENKMREINGSKGGLTREIHKLNKTIEENKNSYENSLKMLNNELLETKKKLEESMSDKYLVRKIRPATSKQKQTMKIKSGYIEGKIINKIKEEI